MNIKMVFATKFIACYLLVNWVMPVNAQGWVAKIDINLNHDLYAYERIQHVSVTFSGITVTGSSETKYISFAINGGGSPAHDLKVTINGFGYQPYDPADPSTAPISANFSGSYAVPCTRGFFEQQGRTTEEQVFIWINVYPRLAISDFTQDCDRITLTTNTCAPAYVWEVSDNIIGGFKVITGESTPSITITREELTTLGFANPYGRKYFRVTGVDNTTSQLQAVDIYYSGPTITLNTTPIKCYGGNDGAVEILLDSSFPGMINDFVITLFDVYGNPVNQHSIINAYRSEINMLTSGTYTVQVQNNSSISTYGSCWSEREFTLDNPDRVIISSADIANYNGYGVSCHESSNGSIRLRPGGGSGTFVTYQWSPHVSTNQFAENLSQGIYKVRVADSNGCWSSEYSYEISQPHPLSASLFSTGGKNGFDVSCHNKSDGAIEVQPNGGVQPYQYEWSDGTKSANRIDLPRGSYSLKVTDANGCMTDENITLIAPEVITFSIAGISSIQCKGDRTGILEIQSIENTIGPTAVVWSSGENGLAIDGIPAGTYTATVSDEQGCSSTATYILEDPPGYTVELSASSNYNGVPISCAGSKDGELTAVLKNETNTATVGDHYTWYKNGFELASAPNLAQISSLDAGLYKVEVTYRNFCKTEDSFLLEEPASIEVEVTAVSDYNGTTISCAGHEDGHIRATAQGGNGESYDFSWNTGASGPDLIDIGEGTYVVSAKDINNCVGTGELIVVGPMPLSAEITVLSDFNGQAISCAGSSDARIKASCSGGTEPYNFIWDSGETGPDLLNVSAGRHNVLAIDANGCSANAETILSDPPRLFATFDNISDYHGFQVSCHGSEDGYLMAGATGGTGSYTYTWHKSTHRQALRNLLKAGSYHVTVTDENGCQDSAEALIKEPAPLALDIPDARNVSCHNGDDGEIALRAWGGAGEFQFSIGNGWQNEPQFSSLRVGTYTITVKDANQCTTTTSHTIAEPPPIDIRITDITPAFCADARGSVAAVITGGTGDIRLEWKNALGETIGTGPQISGLLPGIISITARDENSCEAVDFAGVPSVDGPTAKIQSVTPATCSYSADGEASLEVEGHGPFMIEWPGGLNENMAYGLRRGDYLVKVSDVNNCLTVVTVTIPAPDSLLVETIESRMPLCHGDCNGMIVVEGKGGNGQYTYEWSDAQGASLDNLCAGVYTVKVSDNMGCVATKTVELSNPSPIVIASENIIPPTCNGYCDGGIALSASGGSGSLAFQWSSGETLPVLKNICSGMYTLVVHDDNACTTTSTYTVSDPQTPTLELGQTVTLCTGQTHSLDAGSGWLRHKWESDNGFSSDNQRVQLTRGGTYWLEAIDRSGCVARDTFVLKTDDNLLKANFLLSSKAYVMDTVVAIDITWPLPSTIHWSLPDKMHQINDFGHTVYGQFAEAGSYEVMLSATLGACRDQVTKTVVVLDQEKDLTPNGRVASESFVQEFSVYPNPNNGSFEVTASFMAETPVTITVFDILTSKVVFRTTKDGKDHYVKRIDLGPVSSGMYSLRLDYREGSLHKRMIVR